MALLGNFSANMPGFNGPTPFSSEVGTTPQQGTTSSPSPFGMGPGGRAISPVLGGSGMGDPYASMHQGGMFPTPPAAPPPPPMQQQQGAPQITMPPPPPMMPQQQGAAPGMGNPGPSTSAMNQALMNELQSGATGMQQTAGLVPPNAASVGAGPRNYVPLAGA